MSTPALQSDICTPPPPPNKKEDLNSLKWKLDGNEWHEIEGIFQLKSVSLKYLYQSSNECFTSTVI